MSLHIYTYVRVYIEHTDHFKQRVRKKRVTELNSSSNIVSYITTAISFHIEFQDFSLPCDMGHLFTVTIVLRLPQPPDQKVQLQLQELQ
jgi:hypothetical protein